jgi:hypothetical protein
MTTGSRMLLAYDGSEESAGAIRVAARLLPAAHAVVMFARGEAVAREHAALARIALPDSVIERRNSRDERRSHGALPNGTGELRPRPRLTGD